MNFRRRQGCDAGDIVVGLRSGSSDAVADLYDLLGSKLYSVILAIVRNPLTAEDLVQDTFVRVCSHANQFHGDTSALCAWLLSIGRHRAIDHIRSVRRSASENGVSIETGERIEIGFQVPRPGLQPGDAESLRQVIRRLPVRQRQVIELAYFEGLSQVEIAERLDEPLGTVKSLTRAALKCLRDSMSTDGCVPRIPIARSAGMGASAQ